MMPIADHYCAAVRAAKNIAMLLISGQHRIFRGHVKHNKHVRSGLLSILLKKIVLTTNDYMYGCWYARSARLTTKGLSTLSQKSETVAENGDCRRKRRENSDSRTFLRQCGQGLTVCITLYLFLGRTLEQPWSITSLVYRVSK